MAYGSEKVGSQFVLVRELQRPNHRFCRCGCLTKAIWDRTFSARREAGGWMRMKELYVEGVAAHNGPELCGVAREGGVEALTGETAGWVLSREMLNVRGADAVEKSGRQHGGHRHGEVHAGPARSETPCTPGHHPHGNREVPGSPGAGRAEPQRQGYGRNPLMHGPGKSDPPIVPGSGRTNPGDRARRPWREGEGPGEPQGGKARAGLRAGKPCHRRWPAYEKQQSGTGMNGSPR